MLKKRKSKATSSFLQAKFEKYYQKTYKYYTIIDFNFGWHKDLSTRKSDIHLGRTEASMNITFRVDKSLCQPKLKSVTVLLYEFVFDFLCKISTFTFALNNTKINGWSKLLLRVFVITFNNWFQKVQELLS